MTLTSPLFDLFDSVKAECIRSYYDKRIDPNGQPDELSWRTSEAHRIALEAARIVGREISRQWLIGLAWAAENDLVAIEDMLRPIVRRLMREEAVGVAWRNSSETPNSSGDVELPEEPDEPMDEPPEPPEEINRRPDVFDPREMFD